MKASIGHLIGRSSGVRAPERLLDVWIESIAGACLFGIPLTGTSRHPIRTSVLQAVGVPAAGALFMAISVAPTEEVPMIAASLDSVRVVAMVLAGVAIGWIIVHASGFAPDHSTRRGSSVDRKIALGQTLVATAVALLVAAALLVAFGQIGFDDPFNLILTQTLVLGIPAVIGAAAGRIVL